MLRSIGLHVQALAAVALLATSATAAEPRKDGVSVTETWSRATSPRAQIGAGFLNVRNHGPRADRLVSATSPRSERVEIHTMTMDGGVMRMRQLPGGVAVPANGELRLAPGGNHLMLIGLKQPLKQGESVPVTLRFERAGPVRIRLAVGGAGAMSAAPVEARR